MANPSHTDFVNLGSLAALLAAGLFSACSSLPEPKLVRYSFPAQGVYLDQPPADRKFTILGQVRAKVEFSTMSADHEEPELCRNYYNKAARDLLRRAKKQAHADAVAEVRSIVFFLDGKSQVFKTPECSEDGGEGQILLQGIAIQWVKEEPPLGADALAKPAQKKGSP